MEHYVRYQSASRNKRPFQMTAGLSLAFLLIMALLVSFAHQPVSDSANSNFLADLAISSSMVSFARSGS